MTQQSLADQLYVTRQAVSRWECGARYPDLMTTKCVSSILGVSVDDLLSAGEAENFVKKQPVLESRRAEKVHFGLFLLLAILSAFMLAKHLFEAGVVLSTGEGIVAAGLFYLVRELILYGAYFCLGLYGMWMLWRCEATPFASGLTGAVFFLVGGLHSIALGVVTYLALGYFPLPVGLLGAADFLIALCIVYYFRGNGMKKAIYVYAAGIICLCWRGLTSGYSLWQILHSGLTDMLPATYFSQMLSLLISLTAILTVFYQVRIMERKRRRFAL